MFTVALEEACLHPDYVEEISTKYIGKGMRGNLQELLCDIHGTRIKEMDENGNEYQVLSLTSPGPQAETDPKKAEELARICNDWIAGEIKKNPKRLGAFCSLSMHNPAQAGEELRRAVKLGCCGAIINDYQSTGADGNGMLLYDSPKYDPFWTVAQELDVPIYFHPRWPNDYHKKTLWNERGWLVGATCQFSADLSTHLLALCAGGVFDRFPKAKVIFGHLGENAPSQIGRSDNIQRRMGHVYGTPMKKTFEYYFQNNVYVTTSGNFNTRLLRYVIDVMGVSQVMFSIDYPYESCGQACPWWKTVEQDKSFTKEEIHAVARGNAIKLLKLPLSA